MLTGLKFTRFVGGSASDAFKMVFGSITFDIGDGKGPNPTDGNCSTTSGTISCNNAPDIGTAVHEMFHSFDKRYQELSSGDGDLLASNYYPYEWVADGNYQSGGYKCSDDNCLAHPPDYPGYDSSEAFANLGENWVLGTSGIDPEHFGFADNIAGQNLNNWMNWMMPTFLSNMGLGLR